MSSLSYARVIQAHEQRRAVLASLRKSVPRGVRKRKAAVSLGATVELRAPTFTGKSGRVYS